MPVNEKRLIASHNQSRGLVKQERIIWQKTCGRQSGLIKHAAIKRIILHNRQLSAQCPVDPEINSVFCRTRSPNPLGNDQWINSAILIPRTKHTGGLAMFIIIILTVPIQMKWIPGTCLRLPESEHGQYGAEEAITNAFEVAMMDGIRTGQRWCWWISLWSRRSESQPMWQRWGDACARAWEVHGRAFIMQQSHRNVDF